MAHIDHITWQQKYSVHVGEIDAQHQQLFSIVNRLIDLHNSDSTELDDVLRNLVQYISKHFHAEEMIMKEMRYPSLATHMQRHQAFTDKILEFIGKYKEDDQHLTDEMLLFLSKWLVSHTTNIDMQYAAYSQEIAGSG